MQPAIFLHVPSTILTLLNNAPNGNLIEVKISDHYVVSYGLRVMYVHANIKIFTGAVLLIINLGFLTI